MVTTGIGFHHVGVASRPAKVGDKLVATAPETAPAGLFEARELLAARCCCARVYGWFTEGFDTRDLKEAKTLLGELTA